MSSLPANIPKNQRARRNGDLNAPKKIDPKLWPIKSISPIRRIYATGILMALLVGQTSCQQVNDDRILGSKIYQHDGNLDSLIELWQSIGLNSAFMSPELAAKGGFSQRVRNAGMKSYVIVPVFQNPEFLAQNPGWYSITDSAQKAKEDWVEFVCPSRGEYLDSRIRFMRNIVAEAKPTGISLDFIRFFVYWERVGPETNPSTLPVTCFESLCLADFQNFAGISIPADLESAAEKAHWILAHHASAWSSWKTNVIARTVDRIVRETREIDPDLEINLHALPWRNTDYRGAITRVAGQDFRKLDPYLDYISPMCYAHMLGRRPEWVNRVVSELNESVESSRILPSIQVSKAYLDDPIDTAEFRATLRAALEKPSVGVVFWSWEALMASPQKIRITTEILHQLDP